MFCGYYQIVPYYPHLSLQILRRLFRTAPGIPGIPGGGPERSLGPASTLLHPARDHRKLEGTEKSPQDGLVPAAGGASSHSWQKILPFILAPVGMVIIP